MAYDERFRRKAVEYKDGGHTFVQLKKVFGITSRSYYEWKQNKEQSGLYVLPKEGKATRKRKIDLDELQKVMDETPDLFLKEIAEKFNCSITAVHKRLKRLKITHKKRHLPTRKNLKKSERNSLKS